MRSSWMGIAMLGVALWAAPAPAVPIAAPGFVQLPSVATPQTATGGVVVVNGSVFVGQGDFGAPQSVIRIDPGGQVTTLASGFGSLSGLAYDAENERLVVGSNLVGANGSGQTVYQIPDPFGTPGAVPDAATLELAPTGSTPGITDVSVDPSDPTGGTLLVSLAPFGESNRVERLDLSNPASPELLQTLTNFAGGVVADLAADALYFGDTGFNGPGLVLEAPLSDPTALALQVGSVLGGQGDLALDAKGRLLTSAGSELARIDPETDDTVLIASGFGFATGVDEAEGLFYVLDFGLSEVFVFTAPEPGTFLCAGAGLLVLALRRRREGIAR